MHQSLPQVNSINCNKWVKWAESCVAANSCKLFVLVPVLLCSFSLRHCFHASPRPQRVFMIHFPFPSVTVHVLSLVCNLPASVSRLSRQFMFGLMSPDYLMFSYLSSSPFFLILPIARRHSYLSHNLYHEQRFYISLHYIRIMLPERGSKTKD